MTGVSLDTSGAVWTDPGTRDERFDEWDDLSPFEQGYVEAMFAAFNSTLGPREDDNGHPPLGFSDLAPETLAAIRKDCAAFQARYTKATTWNSGAQFWRDRQRGFYGVAGNRGRPAFPPLIVTLSEDGKVRFQ